MRTIYREGERVRLIDQTRLPAELVFIDCRHSDQVVNAIRSMQIRGAPAIGVAGAYGLALAAQEARPGKAFRAEVAVAAERLRSARPTAVNLAWAVDQVLAVVLESETRGVDAARAAAWALADTLAEQDVRTNRSLGRHGAGLIPNGARILTHCNAGALATVDWGTALGVIRSAVESGRSVSVLVDETRPFLQGARLTAWELDEAGIPYTVITDNMAGYLMKRGEVDLCIVGADRIAANGDVANKIGTYSLSVLARAHEIPFYVAAPVSTIDLATETGDEIPIEERSSEEVLSLAGIRIAPAGATARHPAFDVTPAVNVSAIITDVGILRPPYDEQLVEAVERAKRGEDG